ncbi:MAG: hypothetical protein ACP5E4_01975 [Candidatus Aenigmatarchaeota archaeon]
MKKGIYPAVAYALLFAVGVVFALTIRGFSGDFAEKKALGLEEAEAGHICAYLETLALRGAEIEVFVDIGGLGLESGPLRVLGQKVHICGGGLSSFGSCRGNCRIRSAGGMIEISQGSGN